MEDFILFVYIFFFEDVKLFVFDDDLYVFYLLWFKVFEVIKVNKECLFIVSFFYYKFVCEVKDLFFDGNEWVNFFWVVFFYLDFCMDYNIGEVLFVVFE